MSKKLTGAAGEHFVAFKLCSQGYSVALTRDGSDTIDLMVGDILNGSAVPIQVKTANNARKLKYWEWSVGRKPLTLKDTKLIYAFVDLQMDEKGKCDPNVFIVPVADIAAQAESSGFKENPQWQTFYFQITDPDREKYYEKWGYIIEELNN